MLQTLDLWLCVQPFGGRGNRMAFTTAQTTPRSNSDAKPRSIATLFTGKKVCSTHRRRNMNQEAIKHPEVAKILSAPHSKEVVETSRTLSTLLQNASWRCRQIYSRRGKAGSLCTTLVRGGFKERKGR
jgi:hypothetical protein